MLYSANEKQPTKTPHRASAPAKQTKVAAFLGKPSKPIATLYNAERGWEALDESNMELHMNWHPDTSSSGESEERDPGEFLA